MVDNTQRARDLAQWICLPGPTAEVTIRIKAALDAAWREGVEVAARECDTEVSVRVYPHDVGWSVADSCAKRIRALVPPDPVTAPGHTDLMVAPESIDAFMEANPLPDDPVNALARFFAAWWGTGIGTMPTQGQVATTAREIGLSTWTPNKATELTDLGRAALALLRPDSVGAMNNKKLLAVLAILMKHGCDDSETGEQIAKEILLSLKGLNSGDPITAPDRDAPDPVGPLARLFEHGWQNAHLDFDKAHSLGLLTCVGVGRYIISDMGSAAIALARRGDGG